MEERLDILTQKLNELEKKIEVYFTILQGRNEIDNILKGSYILETDIQKILNGQN